MAAALPIMAIAATAVQTVGQIQQGQAASAAATFNQQQQQKNSAIALQQGVEDQRMFNISARKQLGAENAAYGASGVETGSGSAEDVLRDSAANAELDSQKIRYGALLKSQGYQSQGQLYGMEASSASTGGYLSAAGTLLKGAATGAYYGSGGGNNYNNGYYGGGGF